MKLRISILLAVMAAFAVASHAQEDRFLMREVIEDDGGGGWVGESSVSKGQYLDNPCTAPLDWVWVDYSAYVQGEQAEKGVDRYLFTESTTMGGMYAASGTSDSDVGYASTFEVREYHKVNTPDNFHIVTVITFDPGSRTTSVTLETACGNGMPDSKE